jgi:hypothetical protein
VVLELTTLVVIGTECIGSCESNYHSYDHDHDGPLSCGYQSTSHDIYNTAIPF